MGLWRQAVGHAPSAYYPEHMGLVDEPKYPERVNPHRKDVHPGQRMCRCYLRRRAGNDAQHRRRRDIPQSEPQVAVSHGPPNRRGRRPSVHRLSRKNGRVLYVAMDAVVTPEAVGVRRALGVFRKADDLVQWQWAKNAIKALQSLVLAQHGIARIFLANEWPFPADQAELHPSVNPQGLSDPPQPAEELPWKLLAIIQDIADSLKVLADLAADDTADPNSQPHSLVTLSEAFQSALAA